MSKKQFSIRLETELYDQLNNYHWNERKSLNDVVTEAIKQFIETMEKESSPPHFITVRQGGKQ